MSEKLLRMHIPGMIGPQNVHPRDQKLWEARGAQVLPDETQAEKDAAAAAIAADKVADQISADAQAAADKLRLDEEAARLKKESDDRRQAELEAKAAKQKPTPAAAAEPSK